MDIHTATADQIYRHLLDVQDRLSELTSDDKLTLERDAEQAYGTARRAVEQVNGHLDQARQILARLETRD
ncbi:hypothetical protein ACMX2H_12950 [Arthrobacter sulfonylureivorans]|uniref:hypothetical protein n=1 Tax=Arthrobacter sulfonylureivorans TaxID=2486855 RepID=UPI0039E23EA2